MLVLAHSILGAAPLLRLLLLRLLLLPGLAQVVTFATANANGVCDTCCARVPLRAKVLLLGAAACACRA